MENVEQYPDYDELADQVAWVCDSFSLSYVHGVITAYLCFDLPFDVEEWLGSQVEINLTSRLSEISEQDIQVAREALLNLHQVSLKNLQNEEMGFDLLLPNDDEEMGYRAAALSDWSRGFIEVHESINTELDLSDDAADALVYLNQIIDLEICSEDAEEEEEEKAYFEIVEFVRLSSVLLYLELRLGQKQSQEKVVH